MQTQSPPTNPTITTDTLCANCGKNLFKQPITKHPATHLFLTQCPNCKTYKNTSFPPTPTQNLYTLLKAPFIHLLYLFLLALTIIPVYIYITIFGVTFSQNINTITNAPTSQFIRQMLVITSAIAIVTIFLHALIIPYRTLKSALITQAITLTLALPLTILFIQQGTEPASQHHLTSTPYLLLCLRDTLVIISTITLSTYLAQKYARSLARTFANFLPHPIKKYLHFLWLADNLNPPTPKLAQI